MLRKPDFGMIGDLPNHAGEIPVDRGINIHIDAEAVLRTWMSRLFQAGSTVVEAKGSHAIHVSQPGAVAALIEQAAKKVKAATA